MFTIPDKINNEKELDDVLTTPYPETIQFMKELSGDIMILGIGGKMGPSLVSLAVRACKESSIKKRIVGVSRFTDKELPIRLQKQGVEIIPCDLMNMDEVSKLPDVENIIFMAGRKFGSVGSESLTWMMNTIIPYHVARRFTKSRIVVFSTGCVYALTSQESGGSRESENPQPIGEYANSCLGRERIFQYYSEQFNTPILLFRLNYAIDLRYGVLMDITQSIYKNQPVDLSVPHVNIIWQGDANNRALLSLKHTSSPPSILNITGSEILSVETLANEIGKLLNKDVKFTHNSPNSCYLSNANKSIYLFGQPKISVDTMLQWSVNWFLQGGKTLGKPTHFTVTDGQFLT